LPAFFLRRLVLLLSFLVPLSGVGQSLIAVSAQQCVWKAGDDLEWAAPNLNEEDWHSLSDSKPDAAQVWLRCQVNLGTLKGVAQPAIQVSIPAAYEVFAQGVKIGSAGNVASGHYSEAVARTYPLPQLALVQQSAEIALRITERSQIATWLTDAGMFDLIAAGDTQTLALRRDSQVLNGISERWVNALCYGAVGVVGLVLLGMFLSDRARLELLLLSLACIGLAALRLNTLAWSAQADYPEYAERAIWCIGQAAVVAQTLAFFALAGRRVPSLFLVVIGIALLLPVTRTAAIALPPTEAFTLDWIDLNILSPLTVLNLLVATIAPLAAFWPLNKVPGRLQRLAALSLFWGAIDFAWFVLQMTHIAWLGLPNLYVWTGALLNLRAFITASVIVALLALLFREQRQMTEERALLVGEMASAREIQQYLIPESLPKTPGLAIESAYRPSREVGGDFFQVLPDARDGSTLIVVGDVAGKGLRAGMLAALIVGSIRTASKFTTQPSEILALLNDRLQGRGLVTCQALRVHQNGVVELANAGHLPPYVDGKELPVEAALPLGAVPGIVFRTLRLQFAEDESMLLISDGVLEARNREGELFGFERTRAISRQSAQFIAEAAQLFGQDDDITVLTLKFEAKKPVPHKLAI
jgi:hypothetical protein